MLQTPKNRMSVIVLAVGLYLTSPIVEWFYYTTELRRGIFPVDADSIGLPLAQFMFGWIVSVPFAALLTWFILRSYLGQVSLLSFNRQRRLWSVVWSLLFAYLVFYSIFFIVEGGYRLQPFDVVQSLLMAYLLLCLDSSVVHSKLFSRRTFALEGEA